MKRERELEVRILETVEGSDEDPRGPIELDFVDQYPKNVVYQHVQLLHDDGRIEAEDLSTLGEDAYCWLPKRITAAGHDFLDSARRDASRSPAKRFLEQGRSFSFTVVKDLLLQIARKALPALVWWR